MRSPQSRITTLSYLISWSAKTTIPIFDTLKKEGNSIWTPESKEAFLRLKALLVAPLVLTRPTLGIPFLIYIFVSDHALSATMVQEKEGKQYLIYFTSKVLQGVKRRYQKIEKSALALIITSRRLRPYFQSLDRPPNSVSAAKARLGRKDGGLEHSTVRRGYTKAQALTDFITELTPSRQLASEGREWFLSVDGASNQAKSGARVILKGPDGVLIEQSIHFEFKANNNQAEYETLLVGVRLAQELEAKILTAKSDSKLVTSQVNGEYQARDP
ncbi:Protein NYNRIN, partial [Mucuna pruriens]